ncbi:MAG TPA: ceramide glucosyltransferase [Xanthobacteraceae bacterium]|nr:ceramide glucosyltransferase [Xanthobacteraceae bacterium]
MTAPILAAAAFCIAVTLVQLASIAIATGRFCASQRRVQLSKSYPPVSLVRPLCGIDNYAADTLSSTFALDYPHYEILFCVASANDPAIPFVEALMAEHPTRAARLLIGDDHVSPNPKLNNLVKGWNAARHPWIIIADSNVLMPPDYIQRLFACWRADTGLVASPPIGCRPDGLWAEVECAFLNTYQARWQYIVDTFGFGFAQGKTMLWRRAELEAAGGIKALGREVAEDAAATKAVRDAGLKVRLVDRAFAQPLGRRSAAEVWNRQLRWARLRRASFLLYFLPEALCGAILPMILVAYLASAFHWPPALCVAGFATIWYGAEMALALAAGWHVPALYPFYGLLRDLLLPALFVGALRGNDFVWRGNEMQVEQMKAQRRRIIAHVRPRVREFATGSRRRLRSLRERMSS